MTSITLTDPPEIVALKREFFELDAQEEQLKKFNQGINIYRARAAISTRKQEIARLIFNQNAND